MDPREETSLAEREGGNSDRRLFQLSQIATITTHRVRLKKNFFKQKSRNRVIWRASKNLHLFQKVDHKTSASTQTAAVATTTIKRNAAACARIKVVALICKPRTRSHRILFHCNCQPGLHLCNSQSWPSQPCPLSLP